MCPPFGKTGIQFGTPGTIFENPGTPFEKPGNQFGKTGILFREIGDDLFFRFLFCPFKHIYLYMYIYDTHENVCIFSGRKTDRLLFMYIFSKLVATFFSLNIFCCWLIFAFTSNIDSMIIYLISPARAHGSKYLVCWHEIMIDRVEYSLDKGELLEKLFNK